MSKIPKLTDLFRVQQSNADTVIGETAPPAPAGVWRGAGTSDMDAAAGLTDAETAQTAESEINIEMDAGEEEENKFDWLAWP